MTTSCRVVNYNILVPNGYAEVAKPCLKQMPWPARKERLVERMVQLEPDCICLQEVEKFQEIQECMEHHGYRGVFSQRNNGQEEGCAIFYKQHTFEVISSDAIYFNDGTGRLILHAEIRPKSGEGSFHLLNTHTIWHTSFQDKRLKEIQDLEHIASLKSQNDRPVIVCGDLNTARHEREVFQGFFETGFEDALVKSGNAWKNTFVDNGSQGKYFTTYDYIFSKNIELLSADVCGDPNDLKDDLEKLTTKEPSDHLPMMASFRLKSTPSQGERLQKITALLKAGKTLDAYALLIQFFPASKNEIFGIYYSLIKKHPDFCADYGTCGEDAFLKKGTFQNFDATDELRQYALALKVFELTLAGADEKQGCLFELPPKLREALKWGFWLFEGMPEGDPDFGRSFFLGNPTHPTVFQIILEIKKNGLTVVSPDLKNETGRFFASLNSSLPNEELLREFDQLSPQARELIKKTVWVKAGRPMNQGDDFFEDLIRKDPASTGNPR